MTGIQQAAKEAQASTEEEFIHLHTLAKTTQQKIDKLIERKIPISHRVWNAFYDTTKTGVDHSEILYIKDPASFWKKCQGGDSS